MRGLLDHNQTFLNADAVANATEVEFWTGCLTVLPCASDRLGALRCHWSQSRDLKLPHDKTVYAASIWLLRRKL